ncbi:biotin synthase [Cryptococcus neoformans]|uniref:biotin synthase n=2 Tax=Cryptococcus neoformans TaxID=5207 RepID=A0A854QBF3_CRYNE|nr:biotin synthase [Cryptococcus neoformans var. grubii H99]AUB25765.1 biotin synthase [Cryptococcus neoformans var. grubii]OWT38868.1 biotin synthase [Cryptococcus neoformans var. grubii Bt1]OWZ30921.1 biotin synthase [Cryptococcus neoformans var. grubii AD2-60a]OWZ40084.1 biotin synthase [Cryptococcus neoformans var. grubii AD1-83a]OWZ42976.1 biotin synthase [Cryptococcus neoformans var. grubii C23]OWZ53632.1 biotin synthase [Cryptococcus neoformans var. grubii 125.91]OWZ77393.1 biotin syn|eukprot:XP_012050737.1 biotin synthase [Cryptococcus neoformans var. grubii H99]
MSFARTLRPVLRSTAPTASRGHAVAVDAPFLPPSPSVQQSEKRRYVDGDVRHDWRRSEIQKIFDAPLMEVIYRAATVHRLHQDASRIQLCTLMNIKTGGCTEDCKYCSQSSSYKTPTKASRLVNIEPVLEAARQAKANGSTRFCMGAAWRDLAGKKSGFEKILTMVKEVRGMGMEVCTTLGMLTPEQAIRLKEAGLSAYNHNLDTSREFYPEVVTSRSYDDRLSTIAAVREAGISVCSGGILGLGEQDEDRVGLIHEVSRMPQHPESFPVNTLVPIPGTPLEGNEPVKVHTVLRTIATARIVLPKTIIRLAAGRHEFSETEQAMAFMAGANAIFTGEKMLTTPCSGWDEDKAMLDRWGLRGQRSFEDKESLEVPLKAEQVETGASAVL